MAQTLEHNKAVTTVVPVSIPAFDDDLAIIQKLDDEPNDVGGLTAMELKAKFDEGNVTAQQYINNVLIPAVVADDLTEQTRAAAEAERVANEIERVASETNRLSAENARVTNEANRVIAEAAREQAEQARVNSTTGIVSQATAKASEATAAASAAAQDASIARTSAESARSASGIASSASNAAQAAATSASSSASTASSAANRASASESSAASSAETAKRYAEQASSAGAGDMLQSVYDPTYKRQDIFKYANTKISEHNTNTGAHADIRTALNGKAPAGYGLGEAYGAAVPNGDLNQAVLNGWYYADGATNGPDGVDLRYGVLHVSARRGDLFKEQVLMLGTAGMQGLKLRRVYKINAWEPWEWVNPPMAVGVEYRTTERYMEKPVYEKLVSGGNLGANSTIEFVALSGNNIRMIEAVSYIRNESANFLFLLPYTDNLANGRKVTSDWVYLASNYEYLFRFTTNADLTSFTGLVKVKYIKTTD